MKIWQMTPESPDQKMIEEAAKLLQRGELVAFPTETVYGLGGNGLSPESLLKIFAAKGRPVDNPLILHIADKEMLNDLVVSISPTAEQLMKAFWPGPLTLIMEKAAQVPLEATGGLQTVAIRMPEHSIALQLIRAAGLPIAAPSANLSGKPSPTVAKDVEEDLDDRIAGLIDGGNTQIGLESTVVDCTGALPMILRPGGITREMLEKVVGFVEVDPGLENEGMSPKAPGMKYTHYSPEAQVTILEDKDDLLEALEYAKKSQKKIAFFIPEDFLIQEPLGMNIRLIREGTASDWTPLGMNLYKNLREMDREKVVEIFIQAVPEKGLGVAIMNRMKKAAGHCFWKDRKKEELS